jgi:hypothetical protein
MAGVAAAARGFDRLRTRLAARRPPAAVGTG